MRILLYTGYRTGSYSLGEWLSTELNIKQYHEPFNKLNEYAIEYYKNFTIEKSDKCIIKISPADGFDFIKLKPLFDKIIVLYREDTLSQAESMIWSEQTNTFHHKHINGKFKFAHYKISNEWLVENKKSIDSLKLDFDLQNKIFKSLTDCLILTYEELYYSNLGIKKLENYIKFNAKSSFNNINKLRDGQLKSQLF